MLLFDIKLSLKDWMHEFSLSICAVLALASILTPLLILHGLHTGIIEKLRELLMKDPGVLVVMPSGGRVGGFSQSFIQEISSRPECEFCIGRTREVASELQLSSESGFSETISLEATAQGDPLLIRNGINVIAKAENEPFDIILSSKAASKLNVSGGDIVKSSLGRRLSSGKFDRKEIQLRVLDILPPQATGQVCGFIAPNLLISIQNYRDGMKVDLFNVEGELSPPKDVYFSSFRAYVRDIDSVESFEKWFKEKNIGVNSRSRDIANIKNLDLTLSTIISVIAGTSCAGFFAFMVSTIHASVRRKWKMLGMLRLLGVSRFDILMYPIFQALITGCLGVGVSFILYSGVSYLIDSLYFNSTGGNAICMIYLIDFILIFSAVQLVVILASIRVALKVFRIDPALVIREY
ncbi:ABC transporter permease [Succinivibrio dextrinosolvens]|uniref:ABC transporter permease n=1 Tax=Succinivibrio dextrinosolvens TaxID=83771 RepID=UPI00192304E9|nr:ABC transporter permease [Succinivibrio dextrinosolvens]